MYACTYSTSTYLHLRARAFLNFWKLSKYGTYIFFIINDQSWPVQMRLSRSDASKSKVLFAILRCINSYLYSYAGIFCGIQDQFTCFAYKHTTSTVILYVLILVINVKEQYCGGMNNSNSYVLVRIYWARILYLIDLKKVRHAIYTCNF